MKKLTKIEPQPEIYSVEGTLKWLSESPRNGLREELTDGVIRLIINKLNELTDEVNRMQGNESGTVKEIDKNDLENSFGISAKDKAIQLIELFWCEVEDLDLKETKISKNQAVQCALICVDEILSTCHQKENEIFGISKGIEYWQSVKQELLNLK